MDTFTVRALAQRANDTKRGSQTRQELIAATAELMLEDITRAKIASASDFRIWSQTWMVPRLEDIVRAATGERTRADL